MERLMYLRTSELNYSNSSELGYETANEDSQLSLSYYSMNNDTLDKTLEANIEPLIGLQKTLTVTTTSNHSINLNSIESSIELCETNVENPVPVSSNESINLSGNLSNSSMDSIETIERPDVEYQLEEVSTDLNNEMNQCSSSETVNQNNILAMEKQHDSSKVTVPDQATGLTLQSSSMIARGSKKRQTLVRFHSADEPDAFIPSKRTQNTQRTVLSSWNLLSRRTIVPKPILKKTVSFDQPIKKTVLLTVNDVPKNSSRSQTRSSILRKSMPRQSTSAVAASSSLARKEFITPKGNNVCDICNKAFLLKSTLMTHKLEHKDAKTQTNCKYCDRSFKKPIALSIHLKENCEKIPAAARKKILTGDFNKLAK